MALNSAPARGSRIDRLSQRMRRAIAVVTLVGLPAMYLWSAFWQTTGVPSVVWGPISFLLIGGTVGGALILYRFVRDRADLGARDLDERQRQLRDRALILSYGVLSTVIVAVVGGAALLVLGLGREIELDATLVSALAITVGTLIPVLPVASLAWLEPDDPGDG